MFRLRFYRMFLSDRCGKLLTRVVCNSVYTCKRRYESESIGNGVSIKYLDTTNSKLGRHSVIKVPRFLRKTKDKEQINRYYLVKKLCLEKNFCEAISNVRKWLENEAVTTSTILILNGLLYSLCEQEMLEDVLSLKQIIDSYDIKGDRSTYTVLIDSFGKMRNFEMVSKLLEEMSHLNIVPHYRSYMVAAELALSEKLFTESVTYFTKIESVYKEIHDGFCASLMLNLVANVQVDGIMSVFQDLRENRTRIGEQTMLAIEKHFHSGLSKGKWKTNITTVSTSGVCECCQRKLDEAEFGKPEENLSVFFESLIQHELNMHASGQGSYDKDLTRKDKLQEMFRFLKDEGPFEVVVDGLNVAMHPSHGLDFEPLFKLVENYSSQGQKVIIIAANELINPKRSKSISTADHQKAMTYLKSIATLYFVKHNRSGIDDLFLINAALHLCRKDYHITLVSNDKFMDHRVSMKPETLSYFKRWLSDHRVVVHWYERTKMKLMPETRNRYATAVQKTENSWHFPSIDEDAWMCVERI